MKIPDQVAELLKRVCEHEFVTFTTLAREGWPHARPMDLLAIEEGDESLLLGSVNPGATADNLRKNRRAELLAVEREGDAKVGYTLEGWAEYIGDPNSREVQAARAMDLTRPVSGVFRFHVQRVRVATPLKENTGQFLEGSQPRREPLFRPIDFDVPRE
jgi:hypothetical protein